VSGARGFNTTTHFDGKGDTVLFLPTCFEVEGTASGTKSEEPGDEKGGKGHNSSH